ncbi:MAG TPA: enoyl-CoA hydratase-related protein [Nitrospirota bacterium]|nr:enoyl-CoA hydratase-related protein [Nitrospirota bacterium]
MVITTALVLLLMLLTLVVASFSYAAERDCRHRRAKELLFTGRTVDADEALRIGLVNKVVPPDQLDAEAYRLALRIGGNSLSSLRAVKMLMNFGLNEGYAVGLKEEVTAFSEAFNPDTNQWERL